MNASRFVYGARPVYWAWLAVVVFWTVVGVLS